MHGEVVKRTKERSPRCVGLSVVDELVRAIICGDKLETRRPLYRAPKVQAGDELYVRECHALVPANAGCELRVPERDHDEQGVRYRATWDKSHSRNWTPAIHMPKWAARIFLPLVEVRDEPLQSIDGAGAIREGMLFNSELVHRFVDENHIPATIPRTHIAHDMFVSVWDSLYGKTDNAWKKNPMVRVYRWEKARILC